MAQRKKVAPKKDAPTRGTAPSAANIRDLKKFEASDEAKATEPSDVDAMGKAKRRQVIGHAYGPSKRSQFGVLGGVVGGIAILVVGFTLLAGRSDENSKDSKPNAAPWSQAAAPQTPAVRPQ